MFLNVSKDSLVEYTYSKDTNENRNMDRGHGATYAGSDSHLLEYWEEYQKMIEETKMLDDYLDEECSPRSYDGMYRHNFKLHYNIKIIVRYFL